MLAGLTEYVGMPDAPGILFDIETPSVSSAQEPSPDSVSTLGFLLPASITTRRQFRAPSLFLGETTERPGRAAGPVMRRSFASIDLKFILKS